MSPHSKLYCHQTSVVHEFIVFPGITIYYINVAKHNLYKNISPLDYRYWDSEVSEYLSEEGFTKYKLAVELSLVRTLNNRGVCSNKAFNEIKLAISKVTPAEVYEEEKRIHHDVRALVNCIRSRVSNSSKPFVHMSATSYDIVNSANSARYKDVVEKIFVPELKKLIKTLSKLALHEANTTQVGRTHGQHALPITFGFAIAEYINRLGECTIVLSKLAKEQKGKFSGAVGAYNASNLLFKNPRAFESEVLKELDLKPARHSTQIVPPEPLTRLICEVIITTGVLANLADDMRHLQRTEIDEIAEKFDQKQVGSSTMPHKHNPISFENAKSTWKIITPRIITVFMDQISEHQRDLTNSASSRTYSEIFGYAVLMTKKLTFTMNKLKVIKKNMNKNLNLQKELLLAEPWYIILSVLGYPNSHEKVRILVLESNSKSKSLVELILNDKELKPYIEKITKQQLKLLSDPIKYTGIAAQRAVKVSNYWIKKLKL